MLHLAHSLLHIDHFLLLLRVGLFEHLSLGQLWLGGLLACSYLLSIAHLISFCCGFIGGISLLVLPVAIAWLLLRTSSSVLMIHGLRVAPIVALVVELGWLVVSAHCRCRCVLHVVLLLLLHLLIGSQLASSLFTLRVLHYQLKHLKLIFLHGSHLLHLLLMDALVLIDGAAVAARGLIIDLLRFIDHDASMAQIFGALWLQMHWLLGLV